MPLDERGYKKSYLTRKEQEKEANAEIRQFYGQGAASSGQMPHAQNVDEEGTMRNVSS